MSDDSLYSKHLKIISQDPSTWSPAEHAEFSRLQELKLPPLNLPKNQTSTLVKVPKEQSWWEKYRQQIQMGLGALAMTSLVITILPNLISPKDDSFNAKGSLQVSVFWERAGKISALNDEVQLQDGDKIGASVISSEDSVAYWTITDKDSKVLDGLEDIESSRMDLAAGVTKNFNSSFELVAPNQGENLVVIVCPKTKPEASKKALGTLLDQDFVNKVIHEKRLDASLCVYAGFRLRRIQ